MRRRSRRLADSANLIVTIAALMPGWFGWAMSQTIIGWSLFNLTKSPAWVSFGFALRFLPLAIVGLPAGSLADRFGPGTLLRVSNLAAAILAAMAGFASLAGSTAPSVLLILSCSLGILDAGRIVAGTNMVYEQAATIGRTRAIAASNLVANIGTMVGGALSGWLLSTASTGAASAISATAYALTGAASLGLSGIPSPVSTANAHDPTLRVRRLVDLARVPGVVAVTGLALLVEVFAFSSVGLDPVFAGGVFRAGATGLGLIVAVRALGRIVGSAGLVLRARDSVLGNRLTGSILLFGIALSVYAVAPVIQLALVAIFVAGLASVIVDALTVTTLQAIVPASLKGRAAGLWVLVVGLQPMGVLELGLLAQATTPRVALAVNGATVMAAGIALLLGVAGSVRSIRLSIDPHDA